MLLFRQLIDIKFIFFLKKNHTKSSISQRSDISILLVKKIKQN